MTDDPPTPTPAAPIRHELWHEIVVGAMIAFFSAIVGAIGVGYGFVTQTNLRLTILELKVDGKIQAVDARVTQTDAKIQSQGIQLASVTRKQDEFSGDTGYTAAKHYTPAAPTAAAPAPPSAPMPAAPR